MDYDFEFESKTFPLRSMPPRGRYSISGQDSITRTLPRTVEEQKPCQLGLNLFSRGKLSEERSLGDINDKWGSTHSGVTIFAYLANKAADAFSLIVSRRSEMYTYMTCRVRADEAYPWPFTTLPYSSQSYPLTGHALSLEVLYVQLRELHQEFSQWPGSYNQLLLAGSLDYCASAVKKAITTHTVISEPVVYSLRDYYTACLSLFSQYNDFKTTIRRINLQSISDKFESLQDICSIQAVYPRLEELDISDGPSE